MNSNVKSYDGVKFVSKFYVNKTSLICLRLKLPLVSFAM